MDIYHKLLTGFVLLLLIGGVLGAFEYVSVREEKARVEERQKADAAVMAAKDAQLKESKDALDKASTAFEKFKADQVQATADLARRFDQAQSAQQNATLTAALLGLKGTDVKVGGTASAPTIETPVANLKAYEQACEECKLQLTSATHALELAKQRQAFLDSQAADLQQKVDLLTKERDDLKKFNGGGSLGTRIKHDMKAGFFGAAIEAVLLALTGHLK
jgi:hypothetical protein